MTMPDTRKHGSDQGRGGVGAARDGRRGSAALIVTVMLVFVLVAAATLVDGLSGTVDVVLIVAAILGLLWGTWLLLASRGRERS